MLSAARPAPLRGPEMETGGSRAWAQVLHPRTARAGTRPPGPDEARGWAVLPPRGPSPSLAERCLCSTHRLRAGDASGA